MLAEGPSEPRRWELLESCVGGLQRLDLLLGDTRAQRNARGVNDKRGLDERELDGVRCDDQVP